MKRALAISAVAVCLSLAGQAQAAPLTYSSAELLSLTSPATTFSITAGSVADYLAVNATSVAITLSSSTDGTFTLTSASYDLAVSASSGGGAASLSCSSGVASVVISQSTGQAIYTITPTASQCTMPSGGGSGGGGSGGGSIAVASQYGSPYIPVNGIIPNSTVASSSTEPASSSSLLAEITALKAELAALLAQAGQTPPASSIGPFTRNLFLWMQGDDVINLQKFLIVQASGPAAAKLKTHGATKIFGLLTFNALKEFQKKAGIVPASGYFGPRTRGYVNGKW